MRIICGFFRWILFLITVQKERRGEHEHKQRQGEDFSVASHNAQISWSTISSAMGKQ